MDKAGDYHLEGVNYSYGSTPALRDFSLLLPPGKFYGIVGPNGCGKSTLLDLLVGAKEAQSGKLSFSGRKLTAFKKRELAQEVALVPQNFVIGFDYSVEEVVLMGRHPYIHRFASPSPEDRRLVREAMEGIGISHFAKRSIMELSGGEKQRVVVARALAQDTPVLLFDEATSNLDIRYSLQIFKKVRKLVDRGRTVIAVIHNLNLAAAYCDEIIFMKEGQVAAHGTVSKVMTPEIIDRVFEVESEVRFDPFSRSYQLSYNYDR
ncbi:MAG: ABC transporter ATP-binding protein [Thermodesulfobacteriota bacterium]